MTTTEITYRKPSNTESQMVYGDDILLGSVKKVDSWTVRGTRTEWQAFRKGRVIGYAGTRKAAAELLLK